MRHMTLLAHSDMEAEAHACLLSRRPNLHTVSHRRPLGRVEARRHAAARAHEAAAVRMAGVYS